MDSYLFKMNVERCKHVVEATTYLEMFSYSDPTLNHIEEGKIDAENFLDFVHRKGIFEPPPCTDGRSKLKCLAGVRLVLQKTAKHPETFTPHVISLKTAEYIEMVEGLNLPRRAIESTSCVGPFFWSDVSTCAENRSLQMVYRKSDVRKKGTTRGWELMLSHDFNTAITSGYYKGDPSSDIGECIGHLKACVLEIGHPLLLPLIIFSHDVSFKADIKQRYTRDWLRKLEHAVSMRTEIEEKEGYVNEGVVDFDAINRDLIECHSQALWKPPIAYIRNSEAMSEAMDFFRDGLSKIQVQDIAAVHANFCSRLRFLKMRLEGIETYAHTTMVRIEIQRSALSNIMAQKQSQLDFQMAGEQRKIAVAGRREGSSMKMLSLLGTIFLPGAFIASIFSTSFFDFQSVASATTSSEVSPRFWIYWAVTIPATFVIVSLWYMWEKRRESSYDREDMDIEDGSQAMEKMIMEAMRKRTMSKPSTWDTARIAEMRSAKVQTLSSE